MENENGKSYYGIRLDNSQLQQDAKESEEILDSIGEKASQHVDELSAHIQELINQTPKVTIDFDANVADLEFVQDAISKTKQLVKENDVAMAELSDELSRVVNQYQKLDSVEGEEAAKLRAQKEALIGSLDMRRKVKEEAEKAIPQLQKHAESLQNERNAVESNAAAQASLRQRLRELKMELVELEAAGQRGTKHYHEVQEETARLTDAMGDAQAQASILANDQRGLKGVISGLQGVSGAAAVAQGAIGLFGGENEELQRIMTRVQSLMAITIGLQQVQQTLNKDSAFSLVTLNGLKEFWNKLMGEGNDIMEEENEAIAQNTAAEKVNATAKKTSTAEQVKGNAANVAGATSKTAETGATVSLTIAQKANIVATKAATLAWKGLKVAMISTGIGALIVGVSELVGWLMKLGEASEKAKEHLEAERKAAEDGNRAYATATMQIQDYQRRLESFNGTKKQEKELVKELNNKYGQALGYYKTAAEWKDTLKKKGADYCQMLMMEAKAQALLNKYTEAFVNLQTVKSKAEAGEYDHWYNTKAGDQRSREEAIGKAKEEVDKWEAEYKQLAEEVTKFKSENQLDFHVDPTKGEKQWDAKKAALQVRKAVESYRDAVKEYVKDANDQITEMTISSQEEGLIKEINSINHGTQQKLAAWNKQIEQLAKVRKEVAKQQYLQAGKGKLKEEDWYNTPDGKKTDADWVETVKKDVGGEFEAVAERITQAGEKAIENVRRKYQDALIEEFGTTEQRMQKLELEWQKKFATLPPEFIDEAYKQMNDQLAKLKTADFKLQIDWENVFGDLDKQALPSLQLTLSKVKHYFEENKSSMSVTEIKDFQEAMTRMEDEIASRNPFTALHKSIKDIGTAKDELSLAYAELIGKQGELNYAIAEEKQAREELNAINEKIEDGKLAQGCEEQQAAYNKLQKAQTKVAKARKEENQASNNVIRTQNKVKQAYTNTASNLNRVGSVIRSVGTKAKDLAAIFSDDVADGMGKVLDFTDQIIDATSSVIDAVGDTGKSVAEGVEKTVDAASAGMVATSATAATAISTVEKASAILAIISAALQVATAIASLFNNDAAKQEEIEALQNRIDQLQWELDNKDAVRIQNELGDAVERVKEVYAKTVLEVVKLHNASEEYGNIWKRWLFILNHDSEIYQKTVEKIANTYAALAYTTDKALGEDRYKDARKDLENLAQQQILIMKQIEAEEDKKKTDHDKIKEWEQKIREITEEMAALINEMVEEIIGRTAEDLASELGEAFFEAAKAGEDAMEAWHTKVNDIVADIIQRMMITQYLEPEIGKIFDKYKKQWFGADGQFMGISAVISSAEQMASDIDHVGTVFNEIYSGLSDQLKQYWPALEDVAEREASEKGIATASQESVDELNGRATAIQGHTYSIMENTKHLLETTNLILQSVLNIESDTGGIASRMETVERDVREVRSTLSDLSLKGIRIRS